MKLANQPQIVHVTSFYPPHIGGMEYRTKELSENLAKRGYFVRIISSDIDCKTGKLPSRKNLQIQYLKSVEFAHTAIMPSLFFKLLRLSNNSVVHLHVAHAIIPEITYLVCKIRKIPYVAHIHLDVSGTGLFGFLLPFYKKYLLGNVIRNADCVTVLTEDYKTLIHRKYNVSRQKIQVVPNGTYFTAGKNRKKVLNKPVRLLFVGRLSLQKNVPLLIHALAICIRSYKLNVHLTIAGGGERETEIRDLIKEKQLEKFVTLLGDLPLNKIQPLYHAADIFILTSKEESFGSVLIEAMASGTPVIATNILAVKNIIKHEQNGLLVDQNPKALATAIMRLVNNESLRHKLIKNGLEMVKQYNWEHVTSMYETIYHDIFLKKRN